MVIEHKTIELFGKMIFEKAVIKAPFTKPNLMPDEACFLYVVKGEYNSISEVSTLRAKAKDMVLMKCGSYFGQILQSSSSETYESVAVHFYPEVINKIYYDDFPKILKSTENQEYMAMTSLKADQLLEKYFDSIMFYFNNPDLVTEELIILKIKELFLLLENTKNAPDIHHILSQLFSSKSFELKEIIETNIYSNLSIEQLAQLCTMSLSSFKREFNKLFDESPARYLKRKRLDKSRKLLELSDKSISEIAYECAFGNLASFSKSFKQRFGHSPSEHRCLSLN